MTDRPTLDVATPPGGWGMPWPNVAEIETALPHESWTLLHDAASLLCCLEDPYAERERFAGSDRQRLQTLRLNLPDEARAWRALPAAHRRNGQAALRILTA